MKQNKKIGTVLAAASITIASFGIAFGVAPEAQACTPYGNQAGGFGGSFRTCNPDGSAYICDNGWSPFGRITNCFHAHKGHDRNP